MRSRYVWFVPDRLVVMEHTRVSAVLERVGDALIAASARLGCGWLHWWGVRAGVVSHARARFVAEVPATAFLDVGEVPRRRRGGGPDA